MHADYTIIPKDKVEMIKRQVEKLSGEPTSPSFYAVQSILFNLDIWTQWDYETRRIIGEAEEEKRQASPEVSDVSASSV